MKCCDMKCGCDCRCNQKRIVVELLKEELYGDIESAAYIYADSLPVDEKEGGHEKHNIYDIIQEGNMQTTARLLDQAVEDCKETLFALTKRKLQGSEFDTNEWRIMTGSPVNDQDAYYLAMIVPDDIPDGTHIDDIRPQVYCQQGVGAISYHRPPRRSGVVRGIGS